MPMMDGTGPTGEGPGTGRGMGTCPHCGAKMGSGEVDDSPKEAMAMRQIIQIAADALSNEASDEGESESEGEDVGEGNEEAMDPREQAVRATALRMRS